MSDKQDKPKKPMPQVEIRRRPPTAEPLRPAAPRPLPAGADHPSWAQSTMAPTQSTQGAEVPRSQRRAHPSGPRPSTDQIVALARKERVPNRIAKGDLEGKMKCRIWKKLHPEEAKRFDQAFTVLEANPGIDLADAFGVVQSGMTVSEFMARRTRAKRRDAIKEARSTVSGATIDALVSGWVARHTELALVLAERTVVDVIQEVEPVAFVLERTGRLEKLNVVVLASKATWDARLPSLERDPKLSQKPAPVARQPSRRPISDPRAFLSQLETPISVALRNGMTLRGRLLAVGPFDIVLGAPGEELFVPLHALVAWSLSEAERATTGSPG